MVVWDFLELPFAPVRLGEEVRLEVDGGGVDRVEVDVEAGLDKAEDEEFGREAVEERVEVLSLAERTGKEESELILLALDEPTEEEEREKAGSLGDADARETILMPVVLLVRAGMKSVVWPSPSGTDKRWGWFVLQPTVVSWVPVE